jgi:uncharacterized protein (TIGR03382 family)
MNTRFNILALAALTLASAAGSASATVTTNDNGNDGPRTHDWCVPSNNHPRPVTRDCRDDDRPSRPRHSINDCLPQINGHHDNDCDWSWIRNTRNDCDDRPSHHTGSHTPPQNDCTPFIPRPPRDHRCDTPVTHPRDCDDHPQTPHNPCNPSPCPPHPDCHDRPPTDCHPHPPCIPTPASASLLGLGGLALTRRRRAA